MINLEILSNTTPNLKGWWQYWRSVTPPTNETKNEYSPHLFRWHCFHFSSTALQHRLPGDHLDWVHLIMPGSTATLYGSAGLETTYLEEGKKKKKNAEGAKITTLESNLEKKTSDNSGLCSIPICTKGQAATTCL